MLAAHRLFGARCTLFTAWPILTRPILTRPILTGPIFTGPIFTGPIVSGPIVSGPILTRPLFAIPGGVGRSLFVGPRGFAVRAVLGAVIAIFAIAITFLPAFAGASALLVLTHTGIGEDAEIVVGKLEVIFLRHPVTIEVRVMGELAILLQQLRSIAPRPAVDSIDLLAAALLAVVVTAPATAVIPTINIQGWLFLKTGPPPGIRSGWLVSCHFATAHCPDPWSRHLPLCMAVQRHARLQMLELACGMGSVHPSADLP